MTSISKAESSYIASSLPHRLDGRALDDYRTISLDTAVAPLANGSARLTIGRDPHDGSGGTEIMAASKLEVESGPGRIVCTVTW